MSSLWLGLAAVGVGAYGAYESGQQQSTAQRNMAKEQGAIPFSTHRKQAQKYSFDQMRLMPFYGSMVGDQYQQLATQQRAQQMQSARDVMQQLPEWAQRERQLTSQQRMGDLRDYQRMVAQSPQLQAMQTVGTQAAQSSPLLRLLNGDASGLLGGRSQIAGELESRALADLRLGRGLSAQEERDATQAARGAWASRGLAYSNGAVGAEILNRDNIARNRENERRAFAGGVQGLLQNEDDQRQRYAMGVQSLNLSDLGTRMGVAQSAAAPLLGAFGRRADGAMNSLFNAYGTAMPIAQTSNILSQTPSVFQGAGALEPLYGYQQDVANTNLNMAASNAAARANLNAQLGGGAMSIGGDLTKAGLQARKPTY